MQQRNSEQVAGYEADLQTAQQQYTDETRKQTELIAQLQLQLVQAMDANRKHETLNSELKDKLLALNKSIEERHEIHTSKILSMHAQMREDAKTRSDSDTASQKQRMDETLELNRQLQAAKSDASISLARLNEVTKRVVQLEKEGEEHKRLREEHREVRDDYSRQVRGNMCYALACATRSHVLRARMCYALASANPFPPFHPASCVIGCSSSPEI
jgi:hypothetical protein